jgi:F-type H+-transporting ATPase subunit delta
MKDTRVANRYSAALFEVAKADAILDAVGEDLSLIERSLRQHDLLREMLSQPLVTQERKSKMLADVFGDNITATSLNFLKLLVRKRRADLVQETIDEFRVLLAEHLNIVDATARTAVAMTASQKEALVKSLEKLTGKRVNLTAEVDPNMIGGVIVRIGDNIIDGSVRGRLHRLETQLLGSR